uniref:Rx N-terminal domain-containing protein n=1 Tax=Oryza punctata TaxID=4537 RepID=A0A0E0M595_ORYPU
MKNKEDTSDLVNDSVASSFDTPLKRVVAVSSSSGRSIAALVIFTAIRTSTPSSFALVDIFHQDRTCSEEKVKRLEQLLLRVHMVIEEADGRYITNSCMLAHLKRIVAAMYSGYHVLDTIKYLKNKEGTNDLVNNSLSFATPLKRSRATTVCTTRKRIFSTELRSAQENLETVIGNINQFVILLSGCDRMSRKPYDTYLYIDNFMFGRHVEKQHLINLLLENNIPGPPAVIPIIGGRKVGKKTLVAHVCNDERICSHFSLIFHISGANLSRVTENRSISGRTLVIVEFISDVDDNKWRTFYSSVANLNRGNKVIILTKIQKLVRFGTVKPITVDTLVYEEYRYLFKTLSFGSANPMDHPQLVPMVEEFAMLLQGRFIQANILADVLRKNLNVHFWLCALKGVQITVKKYLSMNGIHPHEHFDQGHPVHLTDYVLYPADTTANAPNNDLPKLIFGDLLTGHIFPPKGNFNLVSWESRIPPYTSFVHMALFCPSHAEDKPESHLSGRKRPREDCSKVQPHNPFAYFSQNQATGSRKTKQSRNPSPWKNFKLNRTCSEEKVKRLEQLLLRVHMVVEEADGRYITNSCMLVHLKMVVAAMYSGYHVLDTIKYMKNKEDTSDLVNDSVALSFDTPLKRSRTTICTARERIFSSELQGALEKLESVVGDMNEFVILLAGCERISHKPYDTYLYIDNFMFGRHVEKQHLMNFLLENNIPGPPAVLPIIGGRGVGKRTLVAHVCNDERVSSQFYFILHINGANLGQITENGNLSARTLVIVEFFSDVADNDWKTFYSHVTNLSRGNKVIILTKIEKLERFGTVKPITLNRLVYDEYRYLFKTLAFGSTNPVDHPQLIPIVEEFAKLLEGRLIPSNILADVLRENLNVQITAKKNMTMSGTHPHRLFDQGHPAHLTGYILSPPAIITPNVPKNDLPQLRFGDLLTGHIFPPKVNFMGVEDTAIHFICSHGSLLSKSFSRSTRITLVRDEASEAIFLVL